MSLFRKEPATVAMVQTRLLDIFDQTSKSLDGALDKMDQVLIGKDVHDATKLHAAGLLAFTIRYAIKSTLDAEIARRLLGQLSLPVPDMEVQRYWERFEEIQNAGSSFHQPDALASLAGVAFQETCGSTGSFQSDDLLRRFGEVALKWIFKMTESVLKSKPIAI